MAAVNFGRFEAAPPVPPGRAQRMVNLAGAGTSLLLVVGVLVWGYRLAVRDVNGIPVIKAVQGPMRVAPEDPGGQISDNVGLTVNRVEADAKGVPQTDKIVLAPPPGTVGASDLSPEALAKAKADAKAQMDRLAADAGSQAGQANVVPPQSSGSTVMAEATPPAVQSVAPVDTATTAAAAPSAAPSAAISSSGDPFAAPAATPGAVAKTGAPAPRPAAAPAAAKAAPDATATATASASTPAPKLTASPVSAMAPVSSPVPRMRPAVVPAAPTAVAATAASASAAEVAAAAAQAIKSVTKAPAVPYAIDAAKLKPGTHLVQVGAFFDRSQAVDAWAHLKTRFPDLMADKSRVIQQAASGGRPFYRLRAFGFKTTADTRRFCAAFDAENANCVPVLVR